MKWCACKSLLCRRSYADEELQNVTGVVTEQPVEAARVGCSESIQSVPVMYQRERVTELG